MNKASRIKSLEAPLADDQFWMVPSAEWNDVLIAQAVMYDGRRSNSHNRKDDILDATERAYRALMPRTEYQAEVSKADEEEEEKQAAAARSRGLYQRMFQGVSPLSPPPAEPTTPPRPPDPRLRWLPAGMRI
jgi:hypothetical protein